MISVSNFLRTIRKPSKNMLIGRYAAIINSSKRWWIDGFISPSYVEDIMGPLLFDYGYGLFRWVCLSGKKQDLLKTDAAAMEIIDPNRRHQDRDNYIWIASQLATCRGFNTKQGKEMADLHIIEDGAEVIEQGTITAVEKTEDAYIDYIIEQVMPDVSDQNLADEIVPLD